MEKIYSREGKLLHIIIRKEDIGVKRQDVIAADQFLQLATFQLKKDATFRPHKHRWRKGEDVMITQEAWVCIEGAFKAMYFDENGAFINQNVLKQGDTSITLHGGHTYEGWDENSKILEFKTGCYYGQEIDKEFIDEV